jgi:hypothetical protein
MPVGLTVGLPMFDVPGPEDMLPGVGHSLGILRGRVLTAADWLGIDPPALVYNPEDPRGSLLLTDELRDWLCAVGNGIRAHRVPQGCLRRG